MQSYTYTFNALGTFWADINGDGKPPENEVSVFAKTTQESMTLSTSVQIR